MSANPLGRWVADERRRLDAAGTSEDQPLTAAERTELARLRKQVSEQGNDVAFLNVVIPRMARLLNVSTSGFYKH